MTTAELVAEVKTALNIQAATTEFDDVIEQKVLVVVDYIQQAGVSAAQLDTDAGVGVIVLGATDLWGLEAGEVRFSPAFYALATQLAAGSSLLTVIVNPADGATGVAVDVAPTLTFNRRIDDYSVALVEYESQDEMNIDIDLDVTEKVLTITPTSDLDAGTKYALVFTATSVLGPSLERTVSAFTTA